MKFRIITIFSMLCFHSANLFAQTQYAWPVTPFNSSQEITGNFAEYRSTTVPAHFHNGTDIPKPDNSPVYPVKNGTVSVIGTSGEYGSSAYVRVGDVAYVHIEPNPTLSVGDQVIKSQTILGTILPGQGHVHFTNGYVGAEKNSLLPGSGLTPFIDTWPPIIRFIRFFQNNTSQEMQPTALSGLVDIVVKVDEQNGQPTTATSRLNNGTYKIGYKILTADTSEVIYEPSSGGLRFQFDSKPSNSYVDIVYFQPFSSTTSHVYQVTNDVTRDNYWNAAAYPNGNYVVMAFTEDTRGNTDTAYVNITTKDADVEPPAEPVFSLVGETEDGMGLSWFPNKEDDLLGYRLFFSFDNVAWSIFREESVLTPSVTDTVIKQILNRDVYFKLKAVDNAPVPNESEDSDVYGLSNGNFQNKVLIVDGFDRTDGGWTKPSHDFGYTYGSAIIANSVSFDTAPNEAIEKDLVAMGDYDAVFWFLGDEAEINETFSLYEQEKVKEYLENGGYLFVSGSQIAWDLSVSDSATASDQTFLGQYLQTEFISDETELSAVTGPENSIFAGLDFGFGETPYTVSTTNVISPANENAIVALQYENTKAAAIQYDGLFGDGTAEGKLVYLAFPFETISEEEIRTELMARVFGFFFNITSVEEKIADENSTNPQDYALLPNYPNPFNPSTRIQYYLPVASFVKLTIYNSLGQKVRTLQEGSIAAGRHALTWDARDKNNNIAPSGVYFIKFEAVSDDQTKTFSKSHKLLLLK